MQATQDQSQEEESERLSAAFLKAASESRHLSQVADLEQRKGALHAYSHIMQQEAIALDAQAGGTQPVAAEYHPLRPPAFAAQPAREAPSKNDSLNSRKRR